MSIVEFKQFTANFEDIKEHLERSSKSFTPPLYSYVNISDYSLKIVNNAKTFEIWEKELLVGLIAIYLNDVNRENAHITNVSIESNFRGRGYSKILLDTLLLYVIKCEFRSVTLNVYTQNTKAVNLYKSRGFVFVNEHDKGLTSMKKIM